MKNSSSGWATLILSVVPFAKYVIWKHKFAKAANLWVKLQLECNLTHKMAGDGRIKWSHFSLL
jgi:hypothetical protein